MTTPDPTDIGAWRTAIHGAGDRPARQELVRQWASALGCVVGQGDDHLIHPPLGLPAPIHGALAHHAVVNCLFVMAPAALPGWVPGAAS